MLAIINGPCAFGGLNNECAVVAELFLEARVTVVPVGAGLIHGKPILECLARTDAREAQPRDAVHLRRQDDAVPVDRGVFGESVVHADDRLISLAEAQHGARHGTVDCHGARATAIYANSRLGDREVVLAHAIWRGGEWSEPGIKRRRLLCGGAQRGGQRHAGADDGGSAEKAPPGYE